MTPTEYYLMQDWRTGRFVPLSSYLNCGHLAGVSTVSSVEFR